MARKTPPFTLRRPSDLVDPKQAERFVHGHPPDPPPAAPVKDAANVQTSSPLDVETSGRPAARAAGAPTRAAVPPSKSLVYRKRTADLRRRMTIYLSEDLSRRLRIYAAEQDQDYSVVLADALGALLDQKGVP